MKKLFTIAAILIIASTAIFADEIDNGVVILPTTSSAETTYFTVTAEAVASQQGLLLKYGTSEQDAILVDGTITKSIDENWNVFGNEETNYFFFFGTGRGSSPKDLQISAVAGEFLNGNINSGVTPEIIGSSSTSSWTVSIPVANPLTGTSLSTSFKLQWDGTNSTEFDSAPAGLYQSTVTLSVTDV
jgi:hypothetical protein